MLNCHVLKQRTCAVGSGNVLCGGDKCGEWKCAGKTCNLVCNKEGYQWIGVGRKVCECFRRHGNVKIFRGHCHWTEVVPASCDIPVNNPVTTQSTEWLTIGSPPIQHEGVAFSDEYVKYLKAQNVAPYYQWLEMNQEETSSMISTTSSTTVFTTTTSFVSVHETTTTAERCENFVLDF